MEKSCQKAKNLMDGAEKILIISHRKPDADTLGAALCLRIWLAGRGKKVTLACIDKPSPVFSFLPYLDEFVDEFELEKYDLMIVVDAGASYMTNFHLKYENFFKTAIPILNIDHHASNDNFGEVNIVDAEAASTTIILYRIFLSWGVEIDEEMATCLLAGIYNDTGSFMHSNTNVEVYRVSADLMERGAKMAEISRAMFRTKSISTLKLWGRVLEKVYVTEDEVVMSVVRDCDYDQAGSGPGQLTGVIDYLSMVPDTKYAFLVNEDRHGNVKGSFRTQQSDIDVSRIAAVFGGGGHPKASGFMIPGRLKEEICYTIVSEDMSKKSLKF